MLPYRRWTIWVYFIGLIYYTKPIITIIDGNEGQVLTNGQTNEFMITVDLCGQDFQ
jgi:hypothetical protein